MGHKKVPFFIRLKSAVMNFDEYKVFAEEKLSIAIKYILKLVLIFAIIITVVLLYKFVKQTNKVLDYIETNIPEFTLQGNTLFIDGDNKRFINGDEDYYFAFIMDSDVENLTDIQEANDYQIVFAILKNKIVMRNENNIENSITYMQINEIYNIGNLSKSQLLELLSENNMTNVFIIFTVIIFICLYIVYLFQILLDILLLSVVGYLLSKIVGVKFKYKSIFNMSVYALTLSVILYIAYIVLNTLTGFYIKLFDIAYNAISYIYIATAILMIKTDLTKQQIEFTKIIKVQKAIEKENQEKDREEPKEDESQKDKKGDEEGEPEKGEPEGNNA